MWDRKKKNCFTKILLSLILLLVSSAVTVRRDKSILFSRVAIQIVIFSAVIALNGLSIKALEKGIGVYGGLFNITTFTQTFNIFIFLISAAILILPAFYPKKVWVLNYTSLSKLMLLKFVYYKDLISNKTGEQFRRVEFLSMTCIIFVTSLLGCLYWCYVVLVSALYVSVISVTNFYNYLTSLFILIDFSLSNIIKIVGCSVLFRTLINVFFLQIEFLHDFDLYIIKCLLTMIIVVLLVFSFFKSKNN